MAMNALAATDTWEGSGPFATGTGNRVIQALAAASDNETVYSGTGSGTVFKYVISPFVVSVAVPAGGRYNPGDALDFTVTWSTGMAVTGTPQLAITLDGVTRYASYLDSPTATTTRFRYVVQAGDTDADGIVIGVLGLNGGTVKSTTGVVATLTLNGVGATAGVLVDSSSPTLPAANIVVNNQTDPQRIVLTFSEALASASIGGGTAWTVKANGGSPGYGVASVALTAAAEVTLTLNAVNIDSAATYIANSAANAHLKVTPPSGLTDVAGNAYAAGEVTESGATHVLDTTPPTISALSASPASDSGNNLQVISTEKARAYWVAVASGAVAPSATQVKAGSDYGGTSVLGNGSGVLPVGTGMLALSGLKAGTVFDIYVTIEDAAGNLATSTESVEVTTTLNGICGSAHGSTVTTAPSSGLCMVGSASAVGGIGPWVWSCAGAYGGKTASCNALPSSTQAMNGVCGAANNNPVSKMPSTALCAVGTASTLAGSGPWTWSCSGVAGGASASCVAPLDVAPTPVNGVCGTANGRTEIFPPMDGLCASGIAGAVSGSGPWTWSCVGSSGGKTAACSAQRYVPPIITGGDIIVGVGGAVIIGGPVVVEAHGGGTVVIEGPNAVGTNIMILPTDNEPVIVSIGGNSIAITSSSGTTQAEVVALMDSTGTRHIVLQISGGGAVQRIDYAAQPAGQVLFALEVGGHTVPVYSTGDAAHLEMVCAADGSCVCYVGRGSLTLDGLVARMTTRSTAGVTESQMVHAGELAAFDSSGNFLGLRLGTRAGGGTGDPLVLDLPANLTLAAPVPRLDGSVVRLDGGNLRDAVVAGAGAQLLNVGSDGVLVLDIGGLRVQALPLGSVTIESDRADGLAMAADGMAQVTRKGVTVRLAPSVADLAQFAADLTALAPDATLSVHADGVLTATLAGSTFAVRPAWTSEAAAAQANGFVLDAMGQFRYAHAQRLQVLAPAFADYLRLVQAIGQAMPGATTATNGDGTVTLSLGGQAWILLPAYTLETAPAGTSLWWPNGDRLMLRNRDGSMQEFGAE